MLTNGPGLRRTDNAPPPKSLAAAVARYRKLKRLCRKEDPAVLSFYEGPERQAWRYDRITKAKFLTLVYRIIWTSGFSADTVFAKERKYLEIARRTLYSGGKYQPGSRASFLRGVAPVLGATPKNRKNRAFAEIVSKIERSGWPAFRTRFLQPGEAAFARVRELPFMGPKTAKLILNQLSIEDTAKDDVWVTRFAAMHGYSDPLECVRRVAAVVGDDQTTVDAVIFWAGWTKRFGEGLAVKRDHACRYASKPASGAV